MMAARDAQSGRLGAGKAPVSTAAQAGADSVATGRPHPALFQLARDEPLPIVADPDRLVSSAFEHRLGGVLLSRLLRGEDPGLSDLDRHRLAAVDLQVQAHHQRLWNVSQEIRARLEPIGVEPIVIKGIAAEKMLYDRTGDRPCHDLDLVIGEPDLEAVPAVLGAFGLPPARISSVAGLLEKRQLQHLDLRWGGLSIDLHFDPLKLGIRSRTQRTIAMCTTHLTDERGTLRVLSPEAALLSFLTHLNKDRFAYLGAYLDVARLTERGDLDWELFTTLVKAEGLEVPVYRSLDVVREELGLRTVPSLTAESWRTKVWDRLWPAEARLRGRAGRTANPRLHLMMLPLAHGRWLDTTRELQRQLLPPRDLLDLAPGGPVQHSYVQRITWDRWHRRD